MIQKSQCLFVFVCVCCFWSCGNEPDPAPPTNFEDIPSPKIAFEANGEEYIFRKVDWNSYFFNEDQDQLSIVLSNSSYKCEIHLMSTRLQNKEFPFTINQQSDNGYGDVQLISLTEPVQNVFGPDDDINYVSSTVLDTDIHFTIESFSNNIIKGNFEAIVKTKKGGKFLELDKGVFELAIVIE